jgi:hypothetical protein
VREDVAAEQGRRVGARDAGQPAIDGERPQVVVDAHGVDGAEESGLALGEERRVRGAGEQEPAESCYENDTNLSRNWHRGSLS